MRKYSFLVVGGSTVLILFIAAGLTWRQKQQSVTHLPSPLPSQIVDTRDWKTYRNEKYGFEMKYPKNLSIASESYRSDFDNNTSEDEIILYDRNVEPSYVHYGASGGKSVYHDGFAFGIYQNSEKITFMNKIKNDNHNYENDKAFQIGQQNGTHYYQGTLIGPSYVAYFPVQDFFFLVYYGNGAGEYSQKVLESILSTLKFSR